MAGDDDYDEHWPELFGSSATRECKVYVSAPPIVVQAEDCRPRTPDQVYRYVPPKRTKSEPKIVPEEPEDGGYYRYVPAKSPKKKKAEEATTYTYVPAPPPVPAPKPEPKIWYGRTKAEIKEDGAAIAKYFEMEGPPKEGPTQLKDEDLVWVRQHNNELVPKHYSTVKHYEGQWKKYPDDVNRWYFVRD